MRGRHKRTPELHAASRGSALHYIALRFIASSNPNLDHFTSFSTQNLLSLLVIQFQRRQIITPRDGRGIQFMPEWQLRSKNAQADGTGVSLFVRLRK